METNDPCLRARQSIHINQPKAKPSRRPKLQLRHFFAILLAGISRITRLDALLKRVQRVSTSQIDPLDLQIYNALAQERLIPT